MPLVKNLTNKRTVSFSTTLPEGVNGVLYGSLRTYGLTVAFKLNGRSSRFPD